MLRGVYKNVFNSEEGNTGRVRSVTAFVDMCFANLDVDGDGKLTFDEFKKIAVIEPQVIDDIINMLINISDFGSFPS
jgi:hypothetical protein